MRWIVDFLHVVWYSGATFKLRRFTMKKLISLISIILIVGCVSGCTSGKSTPNESASGLAENSSSAPTSSTDPTVQLTLSNVIAVYESTGLTIDKEEKPLYALVNAKDGVIFYIDDLPVKLYEFESEAAYDKGIGLFPILADMPKKELIVLDTGNEKAIQIFNGIK